MDFTRDLSVIQDVLGQDTAMADVDAARIAVDFDELSDATDASGFLLSAMKLFALAGNGHTRIIPNGAVHVLPLRLIWAGAGLWAINDTPKEVAAINGVDVRVIFSRMTPWLAGTSQRQKVIGGLPMAWPGALEIAGVPIESEITYQFTDESTRRFKSNACQPADALYPVFETGFPDPSIDPYDTNRANVVRLASFTTDDDAAPERRLARAVRALDCLSAGPVIVDLRGNPGGDFLRHLPILDALSTAAKDHPIGVLADRFTFSAAIVFAGLCHNRLGAPIQGEVMGDTASFHAEGGTIGLPDTGALLRWSDGFHDWKTGKPRATTPAEIAEVMEPCGPLEPDLVTVSTPGDLAQGTDPALDAAFRFMKGQSCAP